MQDFEWVEQNSPKCKTQDSVIDNAVKDYSNNKEKFIVEDKITLTGYITKTISHIDGDIYDPSRLPGFDTGFALFKAYCKLWDKKAHSQHWCDEYIEFLRQHPERFWYALYAYAKGSSKIVKRKGNTKPYTGGELVTVINALGVEEYFGLEMLYVNGDEFYPEPKYVTYFVRFVNAYSGSWRGKKGFESLEGAVVDQMLVELGIKLNSRPRPINTAECPECGCKFNTSTGESITKGAYIEEGKESDADIYRRIEQVQIAKDKAVKEKKAKSLHTQMQDKIARAKKAAVSFGLVLSFDLTTDRVKTAADVLIALAELQEKPRVAASLKIDRETLLWYLEEFRPN